MLTARQWRACLLRTTLVTTALLLLLRSDDTASWPVFVLAGYLVLTAAVLATLGWRTHRFDPRQARSRGRPSLDLPQDRGSGPAAGAAGQREV